VGLSVPGAAPHTRVLAVNELPSSPDVPPTVDLPTPRRALAVGAHPDDIEFGCGATLAKWAAAGCELHHLVLTDGAKGTWDPSQDLETLVATRQEEQRRAAAILGGGDVTFLGFPDGELRNSVREQWEVCRVVRSLRPDVVLGHDPWRRYRLHPDHRHAGYVVTDALVAARDPLFFPEQELAPHRPDALLLWEADVVNHVETVVGHEETKVDALLAHRTQYRSTMGIEVDDRPEATADGGAGDDAPADGGRVAFRRRVLAQLADQGRLAAAPAGEAFHLLTDL
jgi:LmbE family N-acetylglucosaminyl deacetylase